MAGIILQRSVKINKELNSYCSGSQPWLYIKIICAPLKKYVCLIPRPRNVVGLKQGGKGYGLSKVKNSRKTRKSRLKAGKVIMKTRTNYGAPDKGTKQIYQEKRNS